MSEETSTRIDKWLWAARCFRTRSKASAACDAGHVLCNDLTAKPSKTVKVADTIQVWLSEGFTRTLRIKAISDKRGPATEAAKLFEDLTPPRPVHEPPPVLRERGLGRPTKRDRRRLDAMQDD